MSGNLGALLRSKVILVCPAQGTEVIGQQHLCPFICNVCCRLLCAEEVGHCLHVLYTVLVVIIITPCMHAQQGLSDFVCVCQQKILKNASSRSATAFTDVILNANNNKAVLFAVTSATSYYRFLGSSNLTWYHRPHTYWQCTEVQLRVRRVRIP